MKVFKPVPLSLLTRCFEFRQRIWFGVSALAMVTLGSRRQVWAEKDLWQFWAMQPASAWPLEEGMPRARAEYLVCGHAYPHGTDGRACAVSAAVGALRKQLVVHGDRVWQEGRASPAQPFERMPLDWAHAWGGAACAQNPMGMGMDSVERGGVRLRPLPNIETAASRLHDAAQVGVPAGFGPLDGMWPQRAAKRGTYDDAWLKHHFPAVAPDADWSTFNVASADQQQHAPFVGDEPYAFDNLHPTLPRLSGALPGMHARAFVTHRVDGQDKFKEVRLGLRALWFFPDEQRAILVWQGMHEIAEDDGHDIVHLMGALEDLAEPRGAAHYLDVRDKRLATDDGALEALREDDLLPPDVVVPLIDFTPKPAPAFERARARGREERLATHADAASHGLDPKAHAPPIEAPPVPEVRSLDELIALRQAARMQAQTLQREAEQSRLQGMAALKSTYAERQMDYGVIEREMSGMDTRGPPRAMAADITRDFQALIMQGETDGSDTSELQAMLKDPKQQAMWRRADDKLMQAYRTTAHHKQVVDRRSREASAPMRAELLRLHARGASLAGRDLSGADLSGLDLRGADLTRALMEGANLTGADLSGAKLGEAVLAHATLMSTRLAGAMLAGANLGAARTEKVDLEGADLRGAIVERAVLREVTLRGARIDGLRMHEAQLAAIDFSGAHSDAMLVFMERDLRGCRFSGAKLAQAMFLNCELSGVDFSDAVFGKSAFVTVAAEGASFAGLRIDSGAFAQGCRLARADFDGACLKSLSFRGADLRHATLRGGVFAGSDFSECEMSGIDARGADLRAARFVRARLLGAQLQGSNLADAVLQHASLDGADLRQANLFQADMARIVLTEGLHAQGALTTRLRTLPRRRTTAAAP